MILSRKKYLETILCVLLVAIVGVSFIQVLFRYLFHLSLAWSEELARYLFLWLAGLTSAYAFKIKSHFALRFLINKLGPRGQRILGSLVMGITSIFLLLFTWKAVEYTVYVANQTSPSMQISMAIPYSAAAVGGILMLYYLLKNWWAERNK